MRNLAGGILNMVDDYGKPGEILPDNHSCEGACSPDKELKDFCEPPNMGNVLWRLPELWVHPCSNQLSASRFCVFWFGVWVCFISVHETLYGRASGITTMLTAVFATVAGIYFMSTAKDFRWRRRDKE